MKQYAAATQRNRDPILSVLRRVLPDAGTVLEIASGSGEHAVHFASHLPHLAWQPSDTDPAAIDSIDAWRRESGAANLRPPLQLDVCRQPWPVEHAAAVACINMIHISPWAACEALIEGAARVLAADGILYLYGPFRIDGEFTAASNAAFDHNLRQRDQRWGVRDLADVRSVAARHDLAFVERIDMPANNFSAIFAKGAAK